MMRVRNAISPYLLFLPLCYGVFIAADDMTLVVTILPDIMQSLKVPVNDIDRASWLVIAFLIGYSATMPIMGRFSDRWGYRRAFWVALVVFMIGSCGVAAAVPISEYLDSASFIDSYRWTIIARVVQSLGAGAVIPISLAAAEELVGPNRRIIAYGMVGASAEAGGVFGPVWAGAVTDWIGWEWTFWFNIPLAMITVLVLIWMPKGRSRDASIDWLAVAAFLAALTTMTIGLFRVSEPDLLMLITFAVAAIAIIILIVRLRRPKDPAIPQILFRLKDFVWSNATHLLVGAALMIGLISVPLLAGTIYGQSAFESGLLLMRMTIALGVSALVGGIIATYLGVRVPTVAGFVIAAIGFIFISDWGLEIQEPRASIDLALVGIGLGLVIAPITESALRRVPEENRGVASGLLTLARNIGMTFGLAIVASLGAEQFLTSAPNIEEMIANPDAANEAGLAVFSSFFMYAAIACAVAIVPAWLMSEKTLNK